MATLLQHPTVPGPLPKVHYILDPWVSHQIVGERNMAVLRKLGVLVDCAEDADIIILHLEMPPSARYAARMPDLRDKYIVGCYVWETDQLGNSERKVLGSVDEVWTPSWYSAKAFVHEHPRVTWMPHAIVPPTPSTEETRQKVAMALGAPDAHFNVLAFNNVRDNDPRKNWRALLRAVHRVAPALRGGPPMRLVTKAFYLNDALADPAQERHLLAMHGKMSPATITALYEHCRLVAGAHRAEGWGLPFSEAMHLGRLTLAPRFSGNLTFMHDANSLLVHTRRGPVGPKGAWGSNFPATSHWGEVDAIDLEDKLLLAYEEVQSGRAATRIAQAKRDIRRFGARQVQILMAARLRAIADERRGNQPRTGTGR